MMERKRGVNSVMDDDNNIQQHSVVEMPWVLISNQIQQMNQNVNQRFTSINENVNQRFTSINENMNQRFTSMNENVNLRFNDLNSKMDVLETEVKEIKQALANTATKAEVLEMKQSMLTKPGYYTTIIGTIVMLILGALLNQHIHFF